jgi:GT2 family glycosyltransferase
MMTPGDTLITPTDAALTPKLSVVVPAYRRADLLAACLRSLAAHAPPGTEVVVADDSSPGDAVSELAAAFGARHVRLPRRGGFCGAASAGIAAATGEVVELLNDDAEVTAGWAAAALAHFADPAVVAVAPLVMQHGTTLIDTAGDDYHPGGFARKRGHGVPWDNAPPELRVAGECWGVSAAAGFYRRAALVAAGGFPADFGAYFEDVDLSHRLGRLGTVWYEPASVVWHHLSASYGRVPSRRTLMAQSCNEERVWWRNTPRRERVRRLPLHLAVVAAKSLRRLDEGTLAPWLAGRVRGLLLR